jgi:hypothetical protein
VGEEMRLGILRDPVRVFERGHELLRARDECAAARYTVSAIVTLPASLHRTSVYGPI